MRNDDSNQTFVTHIASLAEQRIRVYGVKVYRTSNVLTVQDSFRFQTRPAYPRSLWRKEFGPSKVPADRPSVVSPKVEALRLPNEAEGLQFGYCRLARHEQNRRW